MKKWLKGMLLMCSAAALFTCGALLVGCGNKKEDTVSVEGQIVFEEDDSDEYTRDITLSFKPNGAEWKAFPPQSRMSIMRTRR